MRRGVISTVVLALLLADTAVALQPGAPRSVRTARAVDANARPGALMEDWTLELVDPRSRAQVALRIVRSPDEGSGARLDINHGGRTISTDDITSMPVITSHGRAWAISVTSPSSDGLIRLT